MYSIENENLKITFTEVGALLTSVFDKRRNKECLWQKDPNIWASQDVVMFPLLGPGKTKFIGKEYEMRQHGFARESVFAAEQLSENCIRFTLASNEETLKLYPYDFEFILTYSLIKDTLKYDYEIKHSSKGKMPFMLGSHVGFLISNGAYLETSVKTYHPLDDKGLLMNSVPWKEENNLQITKDLFKKYKTIVLNNENNSRWILHTGDGYVYIYNIQSPLVGVWSNESSGDYVCVEPWWGEPPYENMPEDFEDRNLVQWCKKPMKYSYSITFRKEK